MTWSFPGARDMREARRVRRWISSFARESIAATAVLAMLANVSLAQLAPVVPASQRSRVDAERSGTHDAANLRTVFYNFGMVGDYMGGPVDLSVFHSVEVPKGTGMNYGDGITPFVLTPVRQRGGDIAYVMETGFRERQGISPRRNRQMRFEPRPGYFQPDPAINRGRSPAMSHDPRTWPTTWPDKLNDPDDPGWAGSWNGYFGKRAAADQESFTVMDDDFYDAFDYRSDTRDSTRLGLGLRVEVRGFQWANPQAGNVIFWHYDILNESTSDYDSVVFGLYMDSGVGGSTVSCDGIPESDDDNAFFDRSLGLNLVYTWDNRNRGVDLSGNCAPTGYLGYAYLETPGNALDGLDNDGDGILNERRDGGPGTRIDGRDAIYAAIAARVDTAAFERAIGPIRQRPAYLKGVWWTGDEDMDWDPEFSDVGADGVEETGDTGEGDGIPSEGEPNFDRTDLNESDQIGLTGFKQNRIRSLQGFPVDGIIFFDDDQHWPQRLYQKFTDPNPAARFDSSLVENYNIGFLFASGPFALKAGQNERFSLALAYGADLTELRTTVRTVQQIYDANYQFAVPPPMPTVKAEAGDGYVRLSWDDAAERGTDPVTFENDFQGYRIYRSTDPDFLDPRVIRTGRGTSTVGVGKPITQFDVRDTISGYSPQTQDGVAYWLGTNTGVVHTFTDTLVTNGQQYYYAVCSYDHGVNTERFQFYPSESPVAVSRTPRGGTILPPNVVSVRPNPRVLGYEEAEIQDLQHAAGIGRGTVSVRNVNSGLIPEGHLFALTFTAPDSDSIAATQYWLRDSTDHRLLIARGSDLRGLGLGPTADGLLPVVATDSTVRPNYARSGYATGSTTNTRALLTTYASSGVPFNYNQYQPYFPDSIRIVFDDVVRDTSIINTINSFNFARPARFRVYALTANGEQQLDFGFRDQNNDGTLSVQGDAIGVMSYSPSAPTVPIAMWRVSYDSTGQSARGPVDAPSLGDVYDIKLVLPFTVRDTFTFTTKAERVDVTLASAQAVDQKPYVVPNPYVGSASFEPERFAVSGRGERRMEFRSLPPAAVIRIYNVRGALVQTLHHDGTTAGYVAWNLRTRDNLDLAPGLYIFHVEAPGTSEFIGKFAVIK
ncbi:MAG: hypothetical protein HOP12_04710 [Candidatus Eisenbacteria bacterium]|uniref:T9SS type A sorting domain-containing protein n=1 Tax=Eiseniibacteriota bacterium TaxID=2212470 RepID=A0A849SNH6_UNCEI|nr:hypothetical protein [Candidatus Eisenbacteria bacterium]